jgi:hypothetical protein
MATTIPTLLTIFVVVFLVQCDSKRLVRSSYPIQFSDVSKGNKEGVDYTHGHLSANSLTCFQSSTQQDLSYTSLLMCLIPPFSYLWHHEKCHGLWGSNSIVIQTGGHIELMKANPLTKEVLTAQHNMTIEHFEKWIDLEPSQSRKIFQIPAEPFVVCARSTDPFGRNATFDISFRDTFLRVKDQLSCQEEIFFHVVSLIISSSSWCFPYFAGLTVASFVYANGIQVTISLLCFSGFIVCLAPIMFTAKNRQFILRYLSYFFAPEQHEELRIITKERKSLVHALFLSSVLMIFGSLLCYVFYHYFGIHRELRNTILKIVITISISWFFFFMGRSFDNVASSLFWIPLTINITRKVNSFMNPACFDHVCVVIGLCSCAVSIGSRKFIHSSVFVKKIISGIIISRASIYNLILKQITRSSQNSMTNKSVITN